MYPYLTPSCGERLERQEVGARQRVEAKSAVRTIYVVYRIFGWSKCVWYIISTHTKPRLCHALCERIPDLT